MGVLFLAEHHRLNRFPHFYFQILIALKLGDPKKAVSSLDRLLGDTRHGEYEKLAEQRCLRAALKHAINGVPDTEIASDLKDNYSAAVVAKSMEWITDPEAAFRKLRLPVCFHCDRCYYQSTCRFIGTMAFMRKLKSTGKWDKNGETESFLSEDL